ncbi:MAG TPA: hypothetical protein PKY59_14055 [Pyrinomonadaceae bacterium]|nr:hypothetical protein [Pyrinomonadaceae bacterium]
MATVIPRKTNEALSFLRIFKAHFAEQAALLDYDADEVERAVSACETMIYSIELAEYAKTFSKVCVEFRNSKINSKAKAAKNSDVFPTLTAPVPPAVMFEGNPAAYLQSLFAEIKSNRKYSTAIGEGLGIITAKSAPLNVAEAMPKAKVRPLENSVVRIDWKKGKFDGVIVRSMRGDETIWTEIGRDLHSPFIDTRPPLEPGKPEVRRYQLYFMLDDKPVGNPSPTYETATKP